MTVHEPLLLCIMISVLRIHVTFKLAYYDDNLNKWSPPFTLFVNLYSYLMMAEIDSRNMKYN